MRYDFDPVPMRLEPMRLDPLPMRLDFDPLPMRLDPLPMRLDFDPLPMRLDPLPMKLDLIYSIDYQLKKRFSGRSLKSVDKVSKKLFRSAQHSSMKKIKQANCKK
jgi:hypothetical protein